MTRTLILTGGMLAALAALPGATASISPSQATIRPGPSRGALSTGTFAIRNATIITMASAETVRSGTPLQALKTATVNPAEFLGASREWGTIEAGKRADLILLTANPLDDVSNTMKIEGVSAGGRWFTRAELDAMLAAGARGTGGVQPPR